MTSTKVYNPQEWYSLAAQLYELMQTEFESALQGDIAVLYPKLVVMYEFFRLIRGEAFNEAREPGGGIQKDLYKMEGDLLKQLEQIRKTLNLKDSTATFHIDNMKKAFDPKQAD